mgnify:FL=1
MKSGRLATKKEFVKLIKKIASEECYDAYLRIKNDARPKRVISPKEALILINEINKRLEALKQDGKKKR